MEHELEEQIKSHVLQVVAKSRISIPVRFVDTTTTYSTACFDGKEFEIEFSIKQLERNYIEAKLYGFPSMIHLADLIIAHELGHAKDELTRNYVKTWRVLLNDLWRHSLHYQKDQLKIKSREFSAFHYQMEKIAWEYATNYTLLEHDEAHAKWYINKCLRSYQRYYILHYKMHAHALRLMRNYASRVKIDHQTFNYTIMGQDPTHYKEDEQTLYLHLLQFTSSKPNELDIPMNQFLLYSCIYKIIYKRFITDRVENELWKLITSERKNGITDDDKRIVEELNWEKRKEIRHLLCFMERNLKKPTSSFYKFSDWAKKEIEKKIEGNLDYVMDMNRQYQKRLKREKII